LGKHEHDILFAVERISFFLSMGTPEQDLNRSVDTISHWATAKNGSKYFVLCGCQCLNNFVERLKHFCRGTLETATIVSHLGSYTVVTMRRHVESTLCTVNQR